MVSIKPPEFPVHACRPARGLPQQLLIGPLRNPAEKECATDSEDVLKRQPVIIADLQHPTVEPILKVEVVAEGYLQGAQIADKTNGWRKKLLVADCGRIIYERQHWVGVSAGGVGTPESDVTHVVLDQPER